MYQQKIAFYANDHIGETILHNGIYDPQGIQCIESILSLLSEPIVFDIGNHALVMAKHSQMVYLFEPQTDIAALLHKTMSLNNLHNWKIFEFGLSDKKQIIPLFKNLDGNNVASTFVSELKSNHFATAELHVEIGDDIVVQSGITRLDFLLAPKEKWDQLCVTLLARSTRKNFRKVHEVLIVASTLSSRACFWHGIECL